MSLHEEALLFIAENRVRSHNQIFKHRHPYPTAPFQTDMILGAHSLHPRVIVEAFRKSAKSTIVAEEATLIQAGLCEFRNCLLIGASYDRACERLESIKHEIETNEDLEQVFGIQRTSVWAADKIVLANGVVIQAKGVGQSLRGVKHYDQPPDYVVIDDLEDEESVRTPAARAEMLRWVHKTLIAACTKEARIRILGNRLDPEAVIVKLADLVVDGRKIWLHKRFPILYLDVKTGEETATWPEAFPLEWCRQKRAELQTLGLYEDWMQEYMVEADTPQARIFRPEHFANAVRPIVRTYERCWAMVDPARAIGKRTATTAIPVWSWQGARLIVWDCLIGHWLPDQIIDTIFKVDDEYQPIAIGIEEDALNQFIQQPLRQEMVKRGHIVPVRPMGARKFTQGRGKEDFIKSLQPFFAAGEIVFAKPLPDLQAQFLSFPKGQIDGPNALAYALKMRPGAAVYEEFSRECIVSEAHLSNLLPAHLVLNATPSYLTAVLCQHDGRRLTVVADYVEEGDPGQVAAAIVRRAALEAGPHIRLKEVAHRKQFDQWQNVGLVAALKRVPVDVGSGGDPQLGRAEIRSLLESQVRALPAVQIASSARWTLNALSGGYARSSNSGGQVASEPDDNLYGTLMTGLESFCALTRITRSQEFSEEDNVRTSADGRKYRSAMVERTR